MNIIIIASVIGVCAAARLEHLEPGYLPPGAQGSSSFASVGPSGFDGSNNGLNQGSGSLGGSFQSRSGAPGGDAFGASSFSSPQFNSRNNFENIPQQAFDEETGYQYGPGVNNFRSASARSGNQFGDASPSSSNLVQALNSRFNAPSKPDQQSQQFNGNFRSASAPSQPAFGASQSSQNKAQSGVNSQFNAPNQQQFTTQGSRNQQTEDNDDENTHNQEYQVQSSTAQGPSTRVQQSGTNKAQSGVNSRISAPSQNNAQITENQQTNNNEDDGNDLASNQRYQAQASSSQSPSTRYQPEQPQGNTFNQQNRAQSNLGKQFVGHPAARSQFEAQSGSNKQSHPGFDIDSNTDASQTQSLTSRFNAPNKQFRAASQQTGAQNAAGRQFGASFGAPRSQPAEPNPFRNIPQQAFDERTGYVY